jgi:flagellar basal-body rod modification protein FlgD
VSTSSAINAAGIATPATTTTRTASAATTTGTSQAAFTNGSTGLGKDAFLKLLIAQLRNQDPMKPMEDREFIAQLAQFSSLETLQSLEQRINSLQSTQALDQTAGLIGKRVEATIEGVNGVAQTVTGTVSEVRLAGGVPRMLVGTKEVTLDQITKVLA